MSAKSLKDLVGDEFWQQCYLRLKKEETLEVIHRLFDYIADSLAKRIDGIKTEDGRTISFFSKGREILTINVTRKDLRIYIHPPAKAYFDPERKLRVEKYRFWEGSHQKTSGKYRAMSVWISEKRYLSGVEEIIDHIPGTVE